MIANVRFIYRAVWPANSYFIEAFIPLAVNPGLPEVAPARACEAPRTDVLVARLLQFGGG